MKKFLLVTDKSGDFWIEDKKYADKKAGTVFGNVIVNSFSKYSEACKVLKKNLKNNC